MPAEASGIVATLNHLFDQLSSTLDAKDVFISNAAHQLRNPIAGVVAMSEAVRSAKTIEDVRERSDELLVSANHAANLANKLLALERATEGFGQAQNETYDLVGSLRTLVQSHSETAKNKGVTVGFSCKLTALPVFADKTMVIEAISNLIENALLHAGPDLTSVECAVTKDWRSAVVSVSDDGRGLKPHEVEAALSRFGQVSPSDGSGLGLAIAKAVAEQHGESLELEPKKNGLTVCFRIAVDHSAHLTNVRAR
ncbi:sensor histidine kinase [Cognatiyoonia sp.]|uniref:sensor histidine kinase n=1 Tax=Cognatiyoonia sp. TaxID=2211652 RepID=UPI003F69D2D2